MRKKETKKELTLPDLLLNEDFEVIFINRSNCISRPNKNFQEVDDRSLIYSAHQDKVTPYALVLKNKDHNLTITCLLYYMDVSTLTNPKLVKQLSLSKDIDEYICGFLDSKLYYKYFFDPSAGGYPSLALIGYIHSNKEIDDSRNLEDFVWKTVVNYFETVHSCENINTVTFSDPIFF